MDELITGLEKFVGKFANSVGDGGNGDIKTAINAIVRDGEFEKCLETMSRIMSPTTEVTTVLCEDVQEDAVKYIDVVIERCTCSIGKQEYTYRSFRYTDVSTIVAGPTPNKWQVEQIEAFCNDPAAQDSKNQEATKLFFDRIVKTNGASFVRTDIFIKRVREEDKVYIYEMNEIYDDVKQEYVYVLRKTREMYTAVSRPTTIKWQMDKINAFRTRVHKINQAAATTSDH